MNRGPRKYRYSNQVAKALAAPTQSLCVSYNYLSTVSRQSFAGARESVTAHGLHRPTHERPGADSPSADPTQRWCSDCGKARANVTGKSARSRWTAPLMGTWSGRHRSGYRMEKADLLRSPCRSYGALA